MINDKRSILANTTIGFTIETAIKNTDCLTREKKESRKSKITSRTNELKVEQLKSTLLEPQYSRTKILYEFE